MLNRNRFSIFLQHKLKLSVLVAIYILINSSALQAATIRGKVVDALTHETLPGATVFIEKEKKYASTNDQGIYTISGLAVGSYQLQTKCIGYDNSYKQILTVSDANETINFDFYLKAKSTSIEEVHVQGNYNKESDMSARHSEQLASNVINVMSAKTIENLPDLNVANVMQRTSGVSMMKNSAGNNSQLVIRGMPPRYNSAIVDGITIPSSGSSRSVPLDIIPSVLVGRIEVSKALTPDMEGSGLGGVANVIMKDAPDTSILAIDLSSGYNQYFINNKFATFNYNVVNKSNPAQLHGNDYITTYKDFPTANLVLKNIQAPPDLHIGVSYGNRYFNKKLGVLISGMYQTTYQGSINNYLGTQLNPNTNNFDIISKNKSLYCTQINRKALVVKLDYVFNNHNQISLYNTYLNMDEIRTRHDEDTTYEINWGRVLYSDITNLDLSNIESATLHGKHILTENLDINWSLVYSVASSQTPDLVNVNYDKIIHPNVQPEYLNYKDCVTRYWQWNTDEDKSVYVNFNYRPIINGHLLEYKFGAMARMKYRLNNENEYDFNAPEYGSNYPNPDVVKMFGTGALHTVSIQQQQGDAVSNSANYTANENIEAAYAMVKTNYGKLQILTGARIEFTYQYNTHHQIDYGFGNIASDVFNYYDILPSLHLNYQISERQNMRLSAYKAISRPNYTEVVPYTQVGANGNTSGNDSLKHTVGTCFDARYEFYPKNEEVFTVGIFYKHLINAIDEYTSGNNDKSFINIPNCNNYGLELVGIKYFGNFGINANYTYTKSSILVSKLWNDSANHKTINRAENRPLAGQSPNLINIAIIYRNNNIGFKAQLTYTMQGKNLVNVSSYYGLDSYQLNYHDLGISMEKRLYKNFIIYAKGNNLLNTSIKYQTLNGINTRQLTSMRGFLIGIKFNL